MTASALLRAMRQSSYSSPSSLRYAASLHHRMIMENNYRSLRNFSVLNEFSKQLKGEAKSNPEFQQSIKELNEKMGVVKEDLKVRTKKTTEKLYKSVDGVWTEAEAASKKVSANVKETLSAVKEEVKESFRRGKEESSGPTSSSSNSSRVEDGKDTAGAENSQHSQTDNSSNESPTLFGRLKETLSSSPRVSLAFQKLKEAKLSEIAKKGYGIIKDELNSNPNKKKFIQYEPTPTSSGVRSTKTDIVVVPSKQSRLGEKWESFKTKIKGHPVFNRMRRISQPAQELADDVRERWETSDHPVVHKIQDLNESVFGETSTALSFKEIRRRDPSFSLPDFVAEVQEMIRPVLTAYSKADVETLTKYCSPEVLERCKAERMAYEAHGIFFDNKILHISEVDVRETKMMGSSPIIIIGFQTQQIYCVQDKEGSVTAGGKDTIQTVYYAWAMQQMDIEELGEGAFYPLWRLREMQQIGVQALI